HYRGDEEKFNQQFQQLLVFKNNDKEKALLDLAITLYYSDNNLDMAVEFINRIRKINPANDQALYELAEMYNEENQMSMASKTFKEVVKINPKHFQANYRMGKTFYNAGKYKTALKCFKNALKHCGESGYKMYIKRYIKRCKKKSKK
ncbi:MAG: tetratricopeptide repeat protein, partial [bacterium]|nr:tetratricopeptide repeat protein [bacterium]